MPTPDKSSQNVEAMFNSIASNYDFLNHFLSLGIDRKWRKRLIRLVAKGNPQKVLDVATGTADLAMLLAREYGGVSITGVDISENMLAIGKRKVESENLSGQISLHRASALNLPFENDSFDAAMVAFGVRNFEDLSMGLSEVYRILINGGQFAILEFTIPDKFPVAQLYRFYFRYVLPLFGGIISGSRTAYKYLPESVLAFPEKENFLEIM
ncbi:MAG: bifunctional demethylmenaquinone methyltransferase/2-methoxy-6-polyprenyl-1,4-benzoquinol methylase UbiE, partial [Bacteroidales bacterium]|nr:bifunctional demethylmenaquinone methyltransferase/2-methoxy-6-polyprenyl-1,4-benzoquinol methylase UbiE [Bacteroidales bacterium]